MKTIHIAIMKSYWLAAFVLFGGFFLVGCSGNSDSVTVIPGHSHNDYEHPNPLFDALSYHFKSIEADIFPVGDSLFVAHDRVDIQPGRTLRSLYLEPLKKEIEKNGGSVYGTGETLILLVDIKAEMMNTYSLLHEILEDYRSCLTFYESGKITHGGIQVIVSGERPLEYMQSQSLRYAFFDGRLNHLDSDISPVIMPLVSDHWNRAFEWDGRGEMPGKEREHLEALVAKASQKGVLLRFWATPNQTAEQRWTVWAVLTEAGVGLIGTDYPQVLYQFFRDDE